MSKTPLPPTAVRTFTWETNGVMEVVADLTKVSMETTPSGVAAIVANQGRLGISPDQNPRLQLYLH